MKENVLPKSTCLLWQIRVLVIGIILCGGSTLLCFISAWFAFLPGIIAVSIVVFMFWYLPAYFASYEILFPSGAIIINCGVIIKTSHIMPFSKLIYAQSISTPLAKSFGLAAISLKAARSNLVIPEINASDVNEFITSLTKEDSL